MKNRNWYLLLFLAAITQAVIFNNVSTFTINLSFVWLFFVIIAFRLDRSSLVAIGASLGWFDALVSGGNPLSGAIYGLIIGVVIYWAVALPYWSLVWVRIIASVIVVLAIQIGYLIDGQIQLSLVIMYLFGIFAAIHFILAAALTRIVGEPSYE